MTKPQATQWFRAGGKLLLSLRLTLTTAHFYPYPLFHVPLHDLPLKLSAAPVPGRPGKALQFPGFRAPPVHPPD